MQIVAMLAAVTGASDVIEQVPIASSKAETQRRATPVMRLQ